MSIKSDVIASAVEQLDPSERLMFFTQLVFYLSKYRTDEWHKGK